MTSDDTDTPRGNGDDDEESASDEARNTPPRDPDTGQFLPKDERPDDTSDSPETESTEAAHPEGPTDRSTQTVEGEPAPTAETRATESEPMVEEEPEPEPTDEAHEHESESMDEKRETEAETPPVASDAEPSTEVSAPETPDTDSPTAEPAGEPSTETAAADSKRAQAAGAEQTTATPSARGANARPPGETTPKIVFTTNPNGYARPPTAYLPTHPWLRLPSRAPEFETVSR